MNKKTKYIGLLIGLLSGINNGVLFAENIPNVLVSLQDNQVHSLANSQVKKAKNLYENGNFAEAISVLKIAINNYEKGENTLGQTESLVNLSLVYLKQNNWSETEANLNKVLLLIPNIKSQENKDKLTNFVLEIQGELQLAIAKPELALNTWQKSSKIAYQRKDIQRFIYAEIKTIQALQELGMYGKIADILIKIQPKLEDAPQDLVTAKAWQTLGDFATKFGQIESAKMSFDEALNIAKKYQNSKLVSDVLVSQGNLTLKEYKSEIEEAENAIAKSEVDLLRNTGNLSRYETVILNKDIDENRQRIQEYVEQISKFYQEAVSVTNNPSIQIIAQLTELNLLVLYNQNDISANLITNLADKIDNLSADKTSINQRINFATNLIKLNQPQYNSLILQQLTRAKQESKQLNYQRGISNAWGNLGTLDQQSQQLEEAKILTEKALFLSKQIDAPDLTYQWQWQLGKIAKQQENRQEAISAYSSAVETLQSLRGELVGVNSDLEFDFRTNVEPVYRQLVDILLESEVTQQELKLARNVIESLQIAELDNYFRDACLDVKEVDLDKVADIETAVFYPIILSDRIEVIVSLPDDSLIRHATKIDRDNLEEEIQVLIYNLQEIEGKQVVDESLNLLYNYLIQPFTTQLSTQRVKNLVFVADGFLKSVPMGALYDGDKYLVENYNIAIAPSLKLVQPKTLTQQDIKVLLLGLSEMNQQNNRARVLDDLPHVKTELETIQELIPQTNTLLNEAFTEEKFEQNLSSSFVPIVHIATHGEFSSQLDNSYLLTWDDEIKTDELNNLFNQYRKQKEPVELLVLSACKTAVGDKRAALGLAGIAIKAGARSTIASLWYVSDESTNLLMSDFYQELTNNKPISKAEALRNAQLKMISNSQFNHPYYWSAFILVGNWL